MSDLSQEDLPKNLLAKKVFEASYLTGDFILRSGQHAKEYFDKYRFEAQPALLKPITTHLANLVDPRVEILAGLELGGVPLATSLSLHTGKPVIFVRKEAKSYGTCRIAEGMDFTGKKLCVIEDVITTGGQVKESIEILRQQGAEIVQVLCVIQRAEKNPFAHDSFAFQCLFTMDELLQFRTQKS
jgi:orotate phosphoribosyltransferase